MVECIVAAFQFYYRHGSGGSRLFSVSIKSENRKRRMIDFVDEAASTARSLSLLGGVVCTAATMRR